MAVQPALFVALLVSILVVHLHASVHAAADLAADGEPGAGVDVDGPGVPSSCRQHASRARSTAPGLSSSPSHKEQPLSDRMSRQDRGVGVAADHQTQHAGVQAQRRLAAGSRYAAAAKAPAAEAEAAARRRDKKSRKGRKNRGGARGKSGGDGTPDAGDASGGVLQVPLEEYDWREVEQSMEELLEPALGPEVRYWRGRPSPVSCDDVAAEVVRLHANRSLVYIRTILVRNNQWYFLNPADDADAARKSPEAVDGSRWPLLNATRHCSHYCHYQMSSLWLGVKPLLDAARANASVPRGLPDMVFVLNVADNSPPDQHYGRLARAPLLSLLKRWDEPWWQPPAAGGSGGDDSEAAASLGRLPDGELLQPLQLPSRVRERVAALAQRTGSDGADAAEVSVALPLPEARGGRAAESASWKEAQESEDPLRELVRRFVASMPASVAAADIPEDVSEKPRKRTDKDPEMDLLLPVMHYSAQSLSFFPWANKTDKAIFSGSAFREKYKTSHSPLSVRTHVGQLAAQHPDDLDVRLRELSQKATAPPVSITDHARYRWLLSMDGVSASSRLGLLMGLDSVLVKSRSAYIEAYSRLQVPGVHFLEFWTDPADPNDLLRVLAAARAKAREDPAAVRAAVQANQAIAARYNARLPRQIFARAALLTYRELVPGMDDCVEDLLRHMKRTGHGLE